VLTEGVVLAWKQTVDLEKSVAHQEFIVMMTPASRAANPSTNGITAILS
jgi:hypothetical protein